TTAIRENGDIRALRLESGLYGKAAHGFWNVKTYFYDSEKGIPGAIVNNVFKQSQRQWDRNFFVQGSYQQSITRLYDIQVNAKYANDYMRYLNPDPNQFHIDNNFLQQEWYASIANKLSVSKVLDLDLSTDVHYNTLNSNLDGFVYPKRLTSLVALAGAAHLGKWKMQASMLGTFIDESITRVNPGTEDAVAASNKNELTPAVFLSFKPFDKKEFNLRAFYKHIFRMPTFNDLYYTDIGNIKLQPEYTYQYDLGFTWHKSWPGAFFSEWQLQTDAYYNQVTNKIVAVPKGTGMYRWMMQNIGYVEIRGIDVISDFAFALPSNTLLNIRTSYTYQKAQDFTKQKNPLLEALTYGGQIPYIPWHSGSLISSIQRGTWRVNYSFIYVGERYDNSANITDNYHRPWYTHDLSASKDIQYKKSRFKISGEVNNLLNQDYDVVNNYPMPKRNYKLILSVEL
ncbi:MAG: TonB-dependent receptor, partial [Mucilaginibacter sp.]|uniref:TonB-dependent receptor n=1 Tax=Mucilaginibacter sp. TaxID=1882438 RepID=UPI0031A6C746